MPLPSRLRAALTAVVATAVVGALVACSTPQPPAIRPSVAAAARNAENRYADARVLDDPKAETLTVVPRKSNGALVVFVHGWGQTRLGLIARRNQAGVAHALTASGYTLLAADAKGKAWGDPASVADYRSVIEATQRRYDLRDVYLMGESMGGLASMQLARTLPQVRAVIAWYPVCDLRTMTAEKFRASIRSAWKGRSRAAVSPVSVGSKPMLIWASPADTVVKAATNAAVCAAEARKAGAKVTYFHTTGEHGDASNFSSTAIVGFFEQYRSPGA